MELVEHKAIITELMSDTIEPTRKTELLMKLGDDYGVTQADLSEKAKTLEKTTSERDYYSDMSKKLWNENTANLDTIKNSINDVKQTEEHHQPKRTFQDLMSKF